MITPNAEKRAKVGDVPRFRAFLRDLYVHRRKNLRQALRAGRAVERTRPRWTRSWPTWGIDGTLRSEALDVEQHLRLCAAFAQ